MDTFSQFSEYLRSYIISLPISFLISYGIYTFFKKKYDKRTLCKETQDDSCSSTDSDSSYLNENDHSKLVLIIRSDLKMGNGKVAAQCAHAAVAAYKQALKHPKLLKDWADCRHTKITLKCKDEIQLLALHQEARRVGLLANVVCDAGRTQVAPGSLTVCAVGPGPVEMIDRVTGHLKLY